MSYTNHFGADDNSLGKQTGCYHVLGYGTLNSSLVQIIYGIFDKYRENKLQTVSSATTSRMNYVICEQIADNDEKHEP